MHDGDDVDGSDEGDDGARDDDDVDDGGLVGLGEGVWDLAVRGLRRVDGFENVWRIVLRLSFEPSSQDRGYSFPAVGPAHQPGMGPQGLPNWALACQVAGTEVLHSEASGQRPGRVPGVAPRLCLLITHWGLLL